MVKNRFTLNRKARALVSGLGAGGNLCEPDTHKVNRINGPFRRSLARKRSDMSGAGADQPFWPEPRVTRTREAAFLF